MWIWYFKIWLQKLHTQLLYFIETDQPQNKRQLLGLIKKDIPREWNICLVFNYRPSSLLFWSGRVHSLHQGGRYAFPFIILSSFHIKEVETFSYGNTAWGLKHVHNESLLLFFIIIIISPTRLRNQTCASGSAVTTTNWTNKMCAVFAMGVEEEIEKRVTDMSRFLFSGKVKGNWSRSRW